MDLFNVILFSGASYRMVPQSVPASAANIAAALELLERQRGCGATELRAALGDALSLPQVPDTARSIVVVTDGFIASEPGVFAYVREHLGAASVFAFGIGSSVNRLLIEGLARAGLGEPFVVTDPAEASSIAARFREYLRFPLLTGVRVEYDGFEVHDVEPTVIPDLLAERPLVVHGKWRGEPRGSIRISGTTGAGAYERTIEVTEAAVASGHGALAHSWARTRLATLSDFGAVTMRADLLREEVTRLGLSYNLLTDHTSFVAVHRRVRNPDGDGRDVEAPLPLPHGVPDSAIGATIGVGPEPDAVLLAALVAAGLALAALRRRVGSMR